MNLSDSCNFTPFLLYIFLFMTKVAWFSTVTINRMLFKIRVFAAYHDAVASHNNCRCNPF